MYRKNRIQGFFPLILLLVGMSAIAQSFDEKWLADISTSRLGVEKLPLTADSVVETSLGKLPFRYFTVKHRSTGKFVGGWMASPQALATPAGSLRVHRLILFWPKGKIYDITLVAPQAVATPSGKLEVSDLTFNENGSVRAARFPKGISVKTPSGSLVVARLEWNAKGKIIYASLEAAQAVGTPSGKLSLASVYWKANGSLHMATIAEPQTVSTSAGKLLLKDFISWSVAGKLENVDLAKAQAIATPLGLLEASEVSFDTQGALSSITLSRPQMIATSAGKLLLKDSLFWNAAGKLENADLAKAQAVATPLGLLEASEVSFDAQGALSSITLSRPQMIATSAGKLLAKESVSWDAAGKPRTLTFAKTQAVPTPSGTLDASAASFDEEGNLSSVTLARPQTVATNAGKLLLKDRLSWDPDGKLDSATLVKAQALSTPSGTLLASAVSFNGEGSLSSIALSGTQDVKVGMSTLLVKDSIFWNYQGKLLRLTLAKSQAVLTPAGMLEASAVSLDESGSISSVQITVPFVVATALGAFRATGFGWMEDGTIDSVSLDGEQTVSTPFGNLQAKGTISISGNEYSMGLARAQSVNSPVGNIMVDEISWLSGGTLDSIHMPQSSRIDTPSGPMPTRGVVFDPNGMIRGLLFDGILTLSSPSGNIRVGQPLAAEAMPVAESLPASESSNLDSNEDPYFPMAIMARSIAFPVFKGLDLDFSWLLFRLESGEFNVLSNTLLWYVDGSLEAVYLDEAQMIMTPRGELTISGELSWYPDGSLKGIKLPEGKELSGEVLGKTFEFADLMFFPDGSLRGGRLKKAQPVPTPMGEIVLQAVYIDREGRFTFGVPEKTLSAEGNEYDSILCDAGGAFLGEGRWVSENLRWEALGQSPARMMD